MAGGAYLTYINLTEVKLSENDGCPIEGGREELLLFFLTILIKTQL